jgi:hypothetical protein
MEEDIKLEPIGLPVEAVIIEKEPDPTRWILGVNSKIEYEVLNPTGNYLDFLPTNERQNIGTETWGCTNFWGLSSLEIQIDYKIAHGMFSPRAIAFLHGANCAKISYFDKNGKTNLSDKFTFIKTGTKHGVGNYVHKTPHSVRHEGAIPQSMLPNGTPKTWNEFADPAQITPLMDQLGLEFAEIFETQYETLHTSRDMNIPQLIEKHMKQAPLSLAIAVCPGYMTDDIVMGCHLHPVHCVGLVADLDIKKAIYDSYPEYVKYLDKGYFIPFFLKSIIFEKDKPNDKKMKAIKTEDSPHIYLLDHTGENKILVLDMPTLEALHVPFEIVTQEELDKIPTKGTMVWAEREIKD